jgi:hypothetical protein
LDPKTISYHFIGYPDKLKGFHFCYPDRCIKIVEIRHAIFLEDVSYNEPTRRSQRARRLAISDDYEIYVSGEIQMGGDPTSFEEAMRSAYSSKWLEFMEDEMRSMSINKVWDLEKNPEGAKTVVCKWVYKTKCDSKENIERFKARLVAKGFTQREDIDYTEIFSLVSCKILLEL